MLALFQSRGDGCLHRRPFIIRDTKYDHVSEGSVLHWNDTPEYPISVCAKALDRPLRRFVLFMHEKLDEDAPKRFKSEGHQQQLGLEIGDPLPVGNRIPGEANLKLSSPGVEHPEPDRSDRLAARKTDCEREAPSGPLLYESAIDVYDHILGLRHKAHVMLMRGRAFGRRHETGKMIERERF